MIETVQSLSRNDGLAVTMRTAARLDVDQARNRLWQMAKEQIHDQRVHPLGGWYVLWIDDDAFWQPGTIATMVDTLQQHKEIDLLAGWFGPRIENAAPAIRHEDGSWPKPGDDFQYGEVVEVHRTGFHFVLHRGDLVDRMPDEPFSLIRHDGGEDYAFCRNLRDIGGRIFTHTGVHVAHVHDDGTAYLPFQPAYMVINGQLAPVEQPQVRSYGMAVDASMQPSIKVTA